MEGQEEKTALMRDAMISFEARMILERWSRIVFEVSRAVFQQLF